jgi:hypothetical protein
MKRITFILIACAVVFVATRKIVFLLHLRQDPQPIASASSADLFMPSKPEPLVTSLPPLTNLTLRIQRPSMRPTAPPIQPDVQVTKSPAPSPAQQKKGAKPPRQDPMARVALSLVGVDPNAEEYWALAINDPTLSGSEREDLIEDLNEEGFVDPKNPTLDELPLIMSRLDIIEEYAPSAIDEVNARSFAEAYKDLLNMYVRLTGQPPP